jgi:hypothetical protein
MNIFYCKDCKKDIKVSEKESEGFINWKCNDCGSICMKKGEGLTPVIWRCDTGTPRRNIK